MTTTKETDTEKPDSNKIVWSAIGAALLAAAARLGLAAAAASLLAVLLVNAIADALVYTLAGILALLFACCPSP